MKQKFVLAIVICLVISTRLFAQVAALDRVEPLFWFTGMKNTKLQLLVYGNNIALKKVQFNYTGIKLLKVSKVANPNYLFVDVDIAPTAKPGKFVIDFIEAGRQTLHYTYELKARDKSLNRIQGVTSEDLIYLLMPDRFANGDTTNDVIAGMEENKVNRSVLYARHGGDLQGIINHLDYIKDLGVTAIWCTPEVENNQPNASYHGYAVTDHYKIDPRYGTNELYKKYVELCHAKGLKVIKDIVHNHIGSHHWFMKDLPTADWVHNWPKYTNTNFKDHTVMDSYASTIDKKIMLDGWFDGGMPDLNQTNPFVQNYLTQNNIWWIEYAGIDGLRLDTYPYNDQTYMSKWATQIKAEFPKLGIFGETLVSSVLNQAYFTEGKTINQQIDTHLPGITDAQVKDAIYDLISGKTDAGAAGGINRLYATLANDFVYKNPMNNCIFLDNHDMHRMFSLVGEDLDKYKSAIALLLTTRGIPQLYYGTELLMKNMSNPDGLVREDVKGGWPNDSFNKFSAQGRTPKENEAVDFVKTLANYRKNSTALQTGKLMQFVPENGIYTFFRYNNEKTVMVIINTNNKEQKIATNRYVERMNKFTTAINVIDGGSIKLMQTLTVPANTTLVLELK